MKYRVTIEKYKENGKYQCIIHEVNDNKANKAVTDGWLPCPSGSFWDIRKIVKEHIGIEITLADVKWDFPNRIGYINITKYGNKKIRNLAWVR